MLTSLLAFALRHIFVACLRLLRLGGRCRCRPAQPRRRLLTVAARAHAVAWSCRLIALVTVRSRDRHHPAHRPSVLRELPPAAQSPPARPPLRRPAWSGTPRDPSPPRRAAPAARPGGCRAEPFPR